MERRTKVYHGRQEQERDEADAVAHGWRVVSRDSGREGYRVVYELDAPYASAGVPTRRRGIRTISWLFVIWNLAVLAVLLVRVTTGGYLDGTTQQSFDAITQSGLLMGLVLAWLVGVVVLGLLWFRGRD